MKALALLPIAAAAFAACPSIASANEHVIKPTCWEENRDGQVYRHCDPPKRPETTPTAPVPHAVRPVEPPPAYAPPPDYYSAPPPTIFVPPFFGPYFVPPPPVYIEPEPYAYVEPPPYAAYGPLPCTPKLSPYGGLGDGPFCQIVGDPWAW